MWLKLYVYITFFPKRVYFVKILRNVIWILLKGDKVPVTVQLFYIGIGGFLISILCQLVDEDDKFFTPEISEIPLQDIGVALGVGIGMINIKYIE